MQYENTAPTEYFQRLISQFEGQMQSYRKQIEQTEQHLQVLGSGNSVTSEDIVAAVQKLHAAFTDLAAKYQGLHQALAVQKASYRQLRRSLHGTAPVFETKEGLKKPIQAAPLPSLSGPSPSWSSHFGTGHSCSYGHFWEPWRCYWIFWSPCVHSCFWSWHNHFCCWWLCQPIQHHIWSRCQLNYRFWSKHKFRRRIWSKFNFWSSQPNCWEQKEQTLSRIETSSVNIAMVDVDRTFLLKITLNTSPPGIIL